MKKTLLLIAICLLSALASQGLQAQIKLHSDGCVSIGSLAKDYGVQVQPSGYTWFSSRGNAPYSWVTLAYTNNSLQKCWIVDYPNSDTTHVHSFFVLGDGRVHKTGDCRVADGELQEDASEVDSAGYILDQITGVWYTPTGTDTTSKSKEARRLGVTAQEVEKVLPEVVSADENGLLYVDYEALTVVLIEAVKEQKKEIQSLREILEENGLLKP